MVKVAHLKRKCEVEGKVVELESLNSLGGELVDLGLQKQWLSIQTEIGDVLEDSEPTFENTDIRASQSSCDICEGDSCLAIWSEDGVLYRAILKTWLSDGLKAEVHFIDYDNRDEVDKEQLFREYSCVPEEFLQSDLVDFNVMKPPVEKQAGSLPSLHHVWSVDVKAPSGPLHLAILDDGKVVAAVCSQDRVLAFSSGGKPLADLRPLRRIEGLRAVAKVGKDRVAVLDSKGVQLFAGPGLTCERNLELKGLGTTGGTCLGDEGELVIVNRGTGGMGGKLTSE